MASQDARIENPQKENKSTVKSPKNNVTYLQVDDDGLCNAARDTVAQAKRQQEEPEAGELDGVSGFASIATALLLQSPLACVHIKRDPIKHTCMQGSSS